MAQFNYVAVNKSGEKIKGAIEAPNEAEVRVMLRSQQLRPVKIEKPGALDVDIGKFASFGSGVKDEDLLLFTRQLSILISSGVPLVQGLDVIAGQITNQAFKNIILAMKERITGGSFLWESMKHYKDAFPDLYVSMIRAGEASGALDSVLKRLNKYLDDAYKLKKTVQGALVYPIVVTLVGVLVITVMLVFVIPKFETLLKSSGQSLPEITQIVLDTSHFMQRNIIFIIGALVFVFYAIRQYVKSPDGKLVFDYYVLKVPLFGPMLLKVAVSRFSRTMQTLLTSGINLLDALDICRDAIGNKTLEDGVIKMKAEVEQGKTLSSSMAKNPIFPNMVVQMITVGEATGNMDKMLERVADFYEEDVNNLVSSLTKLIEPLVLVVLGGIVGALMIAMYLPIFQMAGSAGG